MKNDEFLTKIKPHANKIALSFKNITSFLWRGAYSIIISSWSSKKKFTLSK